MFVSLPRSARGLDIPDMNDTRDLKKLTFLVLLGVTVFSSPLKLVAAPKLSDSDEKHLAQACAKYAQISRDIPNFPSLKSTIKYRPSFRRWPASVVSVNSGGAVIKVSIERELETTSVANNGWGETKTSPDIDSISCLWINLAKGDFSKAPSFLKIHGGGTYAWVDSCENDLFNNCHKGYLWEELLSEGYIRGEAFKNYYRYYRVRHKSVLIDGDYHSAAELLKKLHKSD